MVMKSKKLPYTEQELEMITKFYSTTPAKVTTPKPVAKYIETNLLIQNPPFKTK